MFIGKRQWVKRIRTSKSVEKYLKKNKTIFLFQVSDHSGAGNIQIEPFEKGSKSITLLNKGDAEVNIGGWTLTNASGDDESSYKFHRAIAIPAGGSCTVHSADSTEVVMRITSRPLMRVSVLQRVVLQNVKDFRLDDLSAILRSEV